MSEMTDAQVEQLLRKIAVIADAPDDQWLTPEELTGLRELLDYHEDIIKLHQMNRAKRMLWERYRSALLALTAIIAAAAALGDSAKNMGAAAVRWLLGQP